MLQAEWRGLCLPIPSSSPNLTKLGYVPLNLRAIFGLSIRGDYTIKNVKKTYQFKTHCKDDLTISDH